MTIPIAVAVDILVYHTSANYDGLVFLHLCSGRVKKSCRPIYSYAFILHPIARNKIKNANLTNREQDFFTLSIIVCTLSALIHLVVVLLVIATRYIIHPRLVIEIPTDGLLYAFLELQARFPTKFPLEFP